MVARLGRPSKVGGPKPHDSVYFIPGLLLRLRPGLMHATKNVNMDESNTKKSGPQGKHILGHTGSSLSD